ncbi:hypothetical protein [Marinoscillum sp. 108]|jgi:hypothetical protein|uniref:hypothetical protein n=1 Tax=Marinoscillum sp. 108 TaxID=2653151 RepID=UPI0012EF9137|nr:hypothetical protein [Marinoscillum sp. 108]VXD15867.1 conserved hypothetical protein [Marinoscillum sp. 108]
MKKYFADGLLIVFSVLFALLINKLYTDYQTNQKKEFALRSIKQELEQNLAIVQTWKERHSAIRDKLSEVNEGKNDTLKQQLRQYPFFNFGVLTNGQSLINEIMINTAWETSKTTGIISEFDFKTTEKLTYVYLMQEVITDRTITNILDLYFDMETHKIENLDPVLIQFELRFGELAGQEYLLEHLYEDAISQLN